MSDPGRPEAGGAPIAGADLRTSPPPRSRAADTGTAARPTPFGKVLVANRGEVALRVMRSCRALGYRTVAVFPSADANARHVREADQAVPIGGALPVDSYLDVEAVVGAARASGADAVHPGYGFLAENARFARACGDAGLVFIGPSAEAIEAMGDKANAKRLMAAAGVPCIPGYQGDDQSDRRLREEADALGYPLMIKASAGGGGRGMRLVERAESFGERLKSARAEAQHAFGDAAVILERAIVEPRHVEIQVFADRHGHAIHLGERDCSVQRRHQKLIEEAPSPAMTPALREAMGAAALAAVKAIGYEGAGTLEFLLDRDGRFWFMEMNTRLQVEHPVTEALTGLDLVALQLRVAAGEPLPIAQDDVRPRGHAIEVRLCAEDAAHGFLPQSGTLLAWRPPAGLRVEHALEPGSEIAPYYDSMIAKLVAHGASREEARRKLLAGVEDLVALGVTTNQSFLAACLAHPAFVAGEATTAFVERHDGELRAIDAELAAQAATIAAGLLVETAAGATRRPPAPPGLRHDWPLELRYRVGAAPWAASIVAGARRVGRGDVSAAGGMRGDDPPASDARGDDPPAADARGDDPPAADARGDDPPAADARGDDPPAADARGDDAFEVAQAGRRRHEVTIAGRMRVLETIDIADGVARLACDGVLDSAAFVRDGRRLFFRWRGRAWDVVDTTFEAARLDGGGADGGDGTLRASTSGRVIDVAVAVGASVVAGQPVFTLEAMKMEHVHVAPLAGRVTRLAIGVGDSVAAGRVVVEIEPQR